MSDSSSENAFSTKLVTLLTQLVTESIIRRNGPSTHDLRHVTNVLGGFHVVLLSLGFGARTLILNTHELTQFNDDVTLRAHLAQLVTSELIDPMLPETSSSSSSSSSVVDKLSTSASASASASTNVNAIRPSNDFPLGSSAIAPPSDLEPDFGAARPGFVHDPLLIPRVGQPPMFGGGDGGMLVGPNSFGPAARHRRPPGVMPGARFDPIGPQIGGGVGFGGIGGVPQQPQMQQAPRRRLPPGEEPPGFEDEHRYNPYNDMFM
jgi:hypothetical protein